ncbi:MAG: cytochrome c3 family protein [Armatimonadetes bacterium]|nr:cytochrome c3 family protein [Armatimonadota bacterium]
MDPELIRRLLPRFKRFAGMASIVLVVAGVGTYAAARMNPGPAQPIPFSHRLHAGKKDISCFFCHSDADRSSHAGMPAVEKCLLCHQVIIPDFGPIQPLREARLAGKGVPWVRVNVVPDFVYFNHQIHLARGFDCGRCHGDVKQMDRIHKVNRMDMAFCVNCHQQNGASTDCWVCHR